MSDLDDLTREAIETLGGRAPAWKIAEAVAARLDDDDYRAITWNGFVNQVRGSLRAVGSNGLPSAVSVRGEYVQTALLSVDEYKAVIAGYHKRAASNLALAQRFADECEQVHGVRLDVAEAAA